VGKDTSLESPALATPVEVATGSRQAPESVTPPKPVEPVAETPAVPVPQTSPSKVTDISVTIPVPRPDASAEERVAIRMVQRGGEIHVSVRAEDTQLAQSLRQDLGKLSGGLDQAGYRTETWRPVAASAAAESNPNPHREPSPGNSNGEGNGQDARSGGQGGRGSGEQRRRQQDDRPRWVAELEQHTNQ
jgi:hypothetical protein